MKVAREIFFPLLLLLLIWAFIPPYSFIIILFVNLLITLIFYLFLKNFFSKKISFSFSFFLFFLLSFWVFKILNIFNFLSLTALTLSIIFLLK